MRNERFNGPDVLSLMLFLDESRSIKQLSDQINSGSEEAPLLILTLLPFLGLMAHDGPRFVREHFGNIPLDHQSVNRLRNASKSLSSKGLDVASYSEEVETTVQALRASQHMATDEALFGNLFQALHPNIEIVFSDRLPVCTTFNVARYIGGKDALNAGGGLKSDVIKLLGFDIGQASAIFAATAEASGMDLGVYVPVSFPATAVKCRYETAKNPLAQRGLKSDTAFFMLTEMLTQLNSVLVLHKQGYFSDAMFVKYGTITAVSTRKSVNKLINYTKGQNASSTDEASCDLLSTVLPKDIKRVLKKADGLRDALAHYDFIRLLGPKRGGESSPILILSYGLEKTVKMDVSEYLCWLDDAIRAISSGIEALVALNGLAPGISAEQRV